MGIPQSLLVKNPSNVGGVESTSGSGKSPGGGNGNALQYPFREHPMDRGAWWPMIHGVPKVRLDLATKQINDANCRVLEGVAFVPSCENSLHVHIFINREVTKKNAVSEITEVEISGRKFPL